MTSRQAEAVGNLMIFDNRSSIRSIDQLHATIAKNHCFHPWKYDLNTREYGYCMIVLPYDTTETDASEKKEIWLDDANDILWLCQITVQAIVHQRWKTIASAMENNCPSDGKRLPPLKHNRQSVV